MRGTPQPASTPRPGLSLLLRIGLAIFIVGGAADVAHHLLPAALAAPLEPLLGAEAAHAHLATFVGMVAIAAGVIRRGVGHGR